MTTAAELLCDDEARRASVATARTLHGIDFLEVVTSPAPVNQRALEVRFVPKRTATGAPDQPGIADLELMLADLDGNRGAVRIEGGTRTRNIEVVDVAHLPAPTGGFLRVVVDRPGDFSEYTLRLVHARLDPRYAAVRFSFKAGCPSRFDCRAVVACPTEPEREPAIDYLAKDYASFRQALLDHLPTLIPDWRERHEADLGIALVELFSYVGDYLSYYQDAVANEAYLETARSRTSVRRHVRLLDYRMHDGASARTFVHFGTTATGSIPKGTQILTRIARGLGNLASVPLSIPASLGDQARVAADAVFETLHDIRVDALLSEIAIYAWGDNECCLPRGTRSVDLVGDLGAVLSPGDFLLLEEVLGPETGLAGDADRSHRQVVRLTKVARTQDPLLPPAQLPTPLTRVEWSVEDALRFPLCLSVRIGSGVVQRDVSVARGNLALADHGRTVEEWYPTNPTDPTAVGLRPGPRGLRLTLRQGPLAFGYPLPAEYGRPEPAQQLVAAGPAALEARIDPCRLERRWLEPRIEVEVRTRTSTLIEWSPASDLLGSGPFDSTFAVETEDDGRATLRFGDGVFGGAVPDDAFVHAKYRLGVGTAGNVGADSLAHAIDRGTLPPLTAVRNPLPATGGTEAQSVSEVKLLAPAAVQAVQYRAVTEDDYARAAERHPAVAKAAATFRWTGSWLTVFLTIDPKGGYALDAGIARDVRDWVECYTQTGYDLEVAPPRYVPLDLAIRICVKPGYFRSDVEQALLARLSSRTRTDGARGFFHPDAFTFEEPLYLSRLYGAIDEVEGVESAQVTRLQRLGRVAAQELDRAVLQVGRLEVVRLDNDPSFPENGVLELTMLGGA